jgi:hypothetical protein
MFVCVVLTLKVAFFRVLRIRVLNRIAKPERKQIADGLPKYAKYHSSNKTKSKR